jgi:carbonic anhydrase
MLEQAQDRASFLRAAGVAAVAGTVLGKVGSALAADEAGPVTQPTPAQALARLKAGNRRFAQGRLKAHNAVLERRLDVADKQTPFAMILTCADSRVPPEDVFDQRVGDLFVCRVAGNVLEPTMLGSFEYASAHFHSSILVVMGHERCGAVSATVDLVQNGGKAPGSIQSIVREITPAVKATAQGSLSADAYVEEVVKTNARLVARSIARGSTILRTAVQQGKLAIVAARYDLDTGVVTWLS